MLRVSRIQGPREKPRLIKQDKTLDRYWETPLQDLLESLKPESGVKIAILDLDRFQLLNLSQDVIREIL